MAKAGMRRPDPREPHGTESNKKQHFSKNEQPRIYDVSSGIIKSFIELKFSIL